MNPGLAFSIASLLSFAAGVALMQNSTAVPAQAAERTAPAPRRLDAATSVRVRELARAALALGGEDGLEDERESILLRLWNVLAGAAPLGAIAFEWRLLGEDASELELRIGTHALRCRFDRAGEALLEQSVR